MHGLRVRIYAQRCLELGPRLCQLLCLGECAAMIQKFLRGKPPDPLIGRKIAKVARIFFDGVIVQLQGGGVISLLFRLCAFREVLVAVLRATRERPSYKGNYENECRVPSNHSEPSWAF